MLYDCEYIVWPGGSLVSGDLEDNGEGAYGDNATGAGVWTPENPMLAATLRADDTLLPLGGADAIRVGVILTATGTPDYDNVALSIAFTFLDPIGDGSGAMLCRVCRTDWTITTSAPGVAMPIGSGSSLPEGYLFSVGDVTDEALDISPIFPATNIARVTSIASLGVDRTVLVEFASDNGIRAVVTLPTGGSQACIYRITACKADGADALIEDIGIRPFVMLPQIVYRSRGENARAN